MPAVSLRSLRLLACLSPLVLAAPTPAQRGAPAPIIDRYTVVVDAAPERVWRMWTTAEGIASFFAPAAHIELRPGGAYELYIVPSAPEGVRGGEGCRVLAFVPDELLAFTWNAPPSIPRLREAGARTQVVLRLESVPGGRTRVHLVQHGYGEGPDWNRYRAYFGRAWPAVLDRLRVRLAAGEAGAEERAATPRDEARAALERRRRALREAMERELAELERRLEALDRGEAPGARREL